MREYKRTPKQKEYHREYTREYRNNPLNRLMYTMRTGLWSVLSGKRKKARTLDYIGCTAVELMQHLEEQFTDGMNWDNHGQWHVDHIQPLATLKDYDDIEIGLYKLWNYRNLQPLWATDNIRKGDSITLKESK